MNSYNIYLDESGMSDTKTWRISPYFTISGFVMKEKYRNSFKKDVDKLKIKYFGKKSYILHGATIKRDLRVVGKDLGAFSKDLEQILNRYFFFLLFVVIDKEKATKKGWEKNHVQKITYREVLGNLLKFLIAKDYKGNVFVEASTPEQDLNLYKSFFHYITHGIEELEITHEEVRKHLTSLCFVTKLNNDVEEQLADLFGNCGKLVSQLDKGEVEYEDLDSLDKVLISVMRKRLFVGRNARKKRTIQLFEAIDSFKKLP